jgi:hypothetical protein
MVPSLSTVLQSLALILVSLVVGSMFGIWRGYVLADYSPSAFLEVHQGAVRGLNTLMPGLALAALVAIAVLAYLAHGRQPAFGLYLAVIALVIVGGLITRFLNQPINAQVMTWDAGGLPTNWQDLRDSWWTWHIARLATTFCGEVLLIAAIFSDRRI